MLELTGLGSVLRGIGLLYWLLAFAVIGLGLWKGKTWQRKIAWAGFWIVVFGAWPTMVAIDYAKRQAYEREAWAYFKKKCDTEAGEKIYKTFTGVKSVLVIKPLPPATEKDLYDQFWYGDPYSASAHSRRGESKASSLLRDRPNPNGPSIGFEFVEMKIHEAQSERYERLFPMPSDPQRENSKLVIDKPVSRFGIKWEDISLPEDRKYWVAGSRLSIVDQRDGGLVAERIGYFIEAGFGSRTGQRRPWLTSKGPSTTCPESHTWSDRWFVLRVISPIEGKQNGK